jgi:hypothetical protein
MSYQEEIFARYDQVPREIIERSMHDVYIHAAIRQWADSEQTVEQLLVSLVLFLSEQVEEQVNITRRLVSKTPIGSAIGSESQPGAKRGNEQRD